MKKLNCYVTKISVFVIMLALFAGMAGCGGGGDGYNPPPSQNLEIRTWYDLNATRDNLAGNHTLMNDLNSTTPGYTELASPIANGGKGWPPIGTSTPQSSYGSFTGTFDGQGHEIRDLYINRPDEDLVGLFGCAYHDGVIKDVGVVNSTVIGDDYVGGLLGINMGTVSDSYAIGSASGNISVGGLVGYSQGPVSNCYATGTETGNLSIGGLLGYSEETVSNSYSTGTVNGNHVVGGLVGLSHGTVSNSYSTASVTGYLDVGGLVGVNDMGGTVSKSYSNGNVTGNSSVGGLVGVNDIGDPVSNSFWDMETSGQATSAGGTGKNTTEMQDIDTFSGAGWNITAVAFDETNPAYIWNIVDNVTYPFLSWQA